jgi:hypothetical protein
VWIVRVTSSSGVFAVILREEFKEVAYHVYMRFVADAQTDDTTVELLDEEFSIIDTYSRSSHIKRASH